MQNNPPLTSDMIRIVSCFHHWATVWVTNPSVSFRQVSIPTTQTSDCPSKANHQMQLSLAGITWFEKRWSPTHWLCGGGPTRSPEFQQITGRDYCLAVIKHVRVTQSLPIRDRMCEKRSLFFLILHRWPLVIPVEAHGCLRGGFVRAAVWLSAGWIQKQR